MFEVPLLLVLIVVMALIFDFTNGAHDCANAIATVVSTKVLSPRTAVLMAASLNLIGAFLGTPYIALIEAFGGSADTAMFISPIIMLILGFVTLRFYKKDAKV